MSELSVDLAQVNASELNTIKNIILSGFEGFFDQSSDFCGMNFARWYERVVGLDQHTFSIRVSKSDGGQAGKHWLVGVCGLTEIDWISRHARVIFVMVDKDGHKSTVQNHPSTHNAFKKLLDYAFKELCMNKVWISALENNDIAVAISRYGFTADGIRRRAVFVNGNHCDESIFSLTYQDYTASTK